MGAPAAHVSRAAWSTLVATAAVAVLAALVALTGSGPPPVTRTALVPGLAIGAVAQLELRRGDRGVTIDVARGRVIAPTAGAADGAAVTDLLSALAAARLDRRGGPAIARPRATIVLDVGRPRTIVLGDAVAATGQAWSRSTARSRWCRAGSAARSIATPTSCASGGWWRPAPSRSR